MLEFWKNLFIIVPFIPHGHCYLWKPGLVGLHLTSDLLIALAYYSIPITLLYFVRKRQDLPYPWIFLLFSAFIVACGTTHLMDIWTLWYPTYWLSGCLKAITAFVSVLTAIELVPLIPKVLALPSPAQLEATNRELQREIAERKIAEAALQEREQFLSNIYNSVTDTLWVVEQLEDGEFQVVSMNRAIESSTGTLAENWIGKRLDELWDSQTVATIRAHYYDCLQQGKTISYEENLPFGEQVRCFLTTLTPLSAPDSRTRLLGVSMDITERKQVEEELQWKETLLRSMTNASPLAFYVVDNCTDSILYFNHRFCKIWGIEYLEEQMQRGQLKNNDIVPHCLPVLADIPAFGESCKPLQSEENRAVVEDEIPFSDGRTIRRFSTQIRDESDRYFGRLYLFEDITERKQIEEQLQLADFSLEHSSLGLAWVDRDARILRVNQTACEQRGYSREELLSMHVWDADPNFPSEVWPQHWQQLKEQKTLSFTSQHSRKDGSVIPVEITLNYLEFNGKEYNFACARDISDRYRVEEALRASQARLSGVLDIADEAIISVDSSQRITLYNQGAERIFGYTSQEMLGQTLDRLLPERFAASHRQHVGQFAQSAQTSRKMGKRGEIVGRRKDGTEFPAEASISQLELAGEKVFTVFLRDISDRQAALRERKQAEAALKESEARFQAFMNASPTAAWMTDRDGLLLYFNQTYSRVFNLATDLAGKINLASLHRPEFTQEYLKNIRKVVETNQTLEAIELAPLEDGSIGEFLVYKFPLPTSSGEVLVGGVAIDITARKRAEAALEKARGELEIRVKQRTAQLATVNRELRQEINERKQAQAALQASETRLKEVLDNTAAFISSARIHPDKAWEYDYYSPNGGEIFGYEGAEFAADPSLWLSRVPAEDIEAIVLPAMTDLYAGRQINIEYRFRHKNGDLRWLSNSLLARKHKFEDYWVATGIVTDITERRLAEKALQESEQRFAALAKTAPVGIFCTDIQGNCVYGNERSFEMIGLSQGESIGTGWATAIHPDDRDRTLAAWLSFVQQGIPYYCEHRFRRPDGSVIWVLGQAIAQKDVNGNIIGYIGTITDITERKQAEKLLKDYNEILEIQVQERTAALSRINEQLEQEIAERKQIEAQLRRSQTKLSAILDNAGSCIYIKDLNGTYTYVNRLTEEFFGCSEGEIIGANDRKFFPEELVLAYKETCDRVTNSGLVHRFEEIGIDSNGELHYVLSTKVPLKNSEGDVYGLCGISTDITELKKTETALRQSEERMQALLSAIPDLMVRHRVDGTYLDVAGNDRSLQVPREALIGTKLQDTCLPEPIKADFLERFQLVAETGTLEIYEHDLETTDGIHSYETRIVKSGADEVVCLVRDITERKRSQAALQESEERYRTVIAAMAEGIVLQDVDGVIHTCNASAKRILGLTRKQMMGRTSLDPAWRAVREDGSPFPGEEHPAMATLRTGKACSNVVMGVHKPDNSFTWISINSQPLFRAGEPLPYAVVSSFADITARKQAEEALRQSEARYLAILEDQTELIGRSLPDGTLTFVNEAFCRFYGKTREELVGHCYEPNVFEDDRELVARLVKTLSVDNPLVIIENRVIAKGQEVRWTQWVNRGIFDENGQLLEFQGVGRDITDRKLAEENLRRYEKIVAATTDAICLADRNYTYQIVNQAYLTWHQRRPEQIIGQTISEVLGKDLFETQIKPKLDRCLTGETLQYEQWFKFSSEERFFSATYAPYVEADGTISGVVASLRNLTELKRMEVALQQSESTLRAFFNSSVMMMGIVELYEDDFLYLSANSATAQFFGTTPEAMQNRFVGKSGMPRSLLQLWLARYWEAVETQAPVRFEYAHQTPTGQKWLSASVCPITIGSDGHPRLSYIVEDVSDRKRAEEALRQSESTLRSFFDSGSMMMGIVELYDNDIRHLSDNLLAAQFFGKTPEQTKNRFASDMGVLPAHLQRWIDRYREALHTQAVVRFEYPHQTPTEQKWLSASVCPIGISPNGRPRLSYIVEDISDRKLAEEKLKQAEHKYRTLIEQIPGVVYISPLEATTEQAYISPQLQQLLEVPPEEWTAGFFNSWADYVHPEDRDRVWQAVSTTISMGEPLSVEYRMITRNGKTVWVRDRANLVVSPDGQTRVLQGLAFDISDVYDELRLRKQIEQALQESNERFQLAASAVKGFIYDWDFQQNTVLRTQGLFDAVGYRPEEADAQVEWWNEHVHPEDLPNISQQLAEAFSNPTQIYYAIEYRLRHRNGHYVYISDYGAIARDAGGRAIRAVGHAIDVSERRKAEAALQKALQAAQAASIAKSRFLSNMSHELRTPLNAILGFSQVMVRSSLLSCEDKEQLKIINRSGEHLLNLINDILSMAKIEAGQTTLNENRFDLYQLLDDLEQMLKFKAISKGLQLIFERASDLPQYVQTDENKLRQVLINLLGNSIKFTASGQVVLRVKKGRLSEKARSLNLVPETHLLFEVEDTGPGISPDEIETLFDPFVQTESGRKSMQGTGLGLPISRQFVQMMQGNITVNSQVGKGTIFKFNIFAIEVAEADEKVSATTLQVIGLEPNQPIYRILVVEDVQENRQLLSQLLEPLGFELRAAVNGREAIALWSTWKPHLILMDMRMPVMDGYEATREIKILEQQSTVAGENNTFPADSLPTKIIALTASAFDEDRANIMAAGCDDFIHKPFRESMLFEKIAQHLGVRYIYQEDLPPSSPQSATPRKLTPEDLNVMPPEWIAQFQQEVLCANDQLILQLIEQIPESEASLAQALTDLVNNFRLDILFNLLQGSTNE